FARSLRAWFTRADVPANSGARFMRLGPVNRTMVMTKNESPVAAMSSCPAWLSPHAAAKSAPPRRRVPRTFQPWLILSVMNIVLLPLGRGVRAVCSLNGTGYCFADQVPHFEPSFERLELLIGERSDLQGEV